MQKNLRKTKGITLIALIVTVIILLILAGIAISPFIGEGGILGQATNAAMETKKAQYKEGLELMGAELKIEKEVEGYDAKWYIDEHEKKIPEDALFKDSKVKRKTEESLRVETPEGFVFFVTDKDVKYLGQMGDDEAPELNDGQIKMSKDPEEWTNKNVKVTLQLLKEIQKENLFIEYTIDNGKSWHAYSEPFTVKDNDTTVKARISNIAEEASGEIEVGKVTNIDKLKPTKPIVEVVEKSEEYMKFKIKCDDAEPTLDSRIFWCQSLYLEREWIGRYIRIYW